MKKPRYGTPDGTSDECSGLADVALLGELGEDQVAAVKFRDGGAGLFIPDRMRRRLSPRALRLARDVQSSAMKRENLLREIDRLVPELRAAGASWSVIGWVTNMTAAGALKRWGGDDDSPED